MLRTMLLSRGEVERRAKAGKTRRRLTPPLAAHARKARGAEPTSESKTQSKTQNVPLCPRSIPYQSKNTAHITKHQKTLSHAMTASAAEAARLFADAPTSPLPSPQQQQVHRPFFEREREERRMQHPQRQTTDLKGGLSSSRIEVRQARMRVWFGIRVKTKDRSMMMIMAANSPRSHGTLKQAPYTRMHRAVGTEHRVLDTMCSSGLREAVRGHGMAARGTFRLAGARRGGGRVFLFRSARAERGGSMRSGLLAPPCI